MLFLTIVGWLVFIITTLLLVSATFEWVYREFLRSEIQKTVEELQMRMNGKVYKYAIGRLFVAFVVWVLSGAFIFGAFS